MPQTPREANRGLRWFEPIQSGCLVLSLALNAYLGVLAKRESDRAEETLQRIKIEKEAPAVQATRIVISGDVIRALMTGEKTTLEIYGIPHPEFVETPFGREVYARLQASGLRDLKGTSVEFLSFTNHGPRSTESLSVIGSEPSQKLSLGSLVDGTSKLVPISFQTQQPYTSGTAPFEIVAFSYQLQLAGEQRTGGGQISPRGLVSWIPTVGNFHGIGRAMNDDDLERYLYPRTR